MLSQRFDLDEAERVALLHEALDAAADLLQARLVLADPGEVLLDQRAVGVALRARALTQPGDEAQDFGLHLLAQPGQTLLRVVHEFLQEEDLIC